MLNKKEYILEDNRGVSQSVSPPAPCLKAHFNHAKYTAEDEISSQLSAKL